MAVSLEWDFSEEADFKCHLHLASVFVRGLMEAGTATKGHSFLVSVSKPQITLVSVLNAYCSTSCKGHFLRS